jgi:hypothetical protein
MEAFGELIGLFDEAEITQLMDSLLATEFQSNKKKGNFIHQSKDQKKGDLDTLFFLVSILEKSKLKTFTISPKVLQTLFENSLEKNQKAIFPLLKSEKLKVGTLKDSIIYPAEFSNFINKELFTKTLKAWFDVAVWVCSRSLLAMFWMVEYVGANELTNEEKTMVIGALSDMFLNHQDCKKVEWKTGVPKSIHKVLKALCRSNLDHQISVISGFLKGNVVVQDDCKWMGGYLITKCSFVEKLDVLIKELMDYKFTKFTKYTFKALLKMMEFGIDVDSLSLLIIRRYLAIQKDALNFETESEVEQIIILLINHTKETTVDLKKVFVSILKYRYHDIKYLQLLKALVKLIKKV